ncbi:DUF4185 domain-containing protein [Pseudactinotalea terrae]|uniref:DUF4185 domain-containing protein n=1 Tax=Pseudactinotalea terrae TaxID=1743262 RepID=UPI0012E2B05B|nr:DUF4185 domain-containing protein [Pseudactinotalea terrae]
MTTRSRARTAAAPLAAAALALGACTSESPTGEPPPADPHAPTSTTFATIDIPYHSSVATDSDGDLWPAAWADDGYLYTANGDGRGFSTAAFADIVVNRVDGTPEEGLTGMRLASGAAVAPLWSDPAEYNRKPTGMVAVDGDGDGRDELYLAVQDLRMKPAALAFNDAPAATIVRSDDYGRTWTWADEPMFSDYVFTTVMFLDLGQSNGLAAAVEPGGEEYVYAYGLDNNWRDSFSDTVPDPVDLYLARVPASSIQDRSAWEFFAGAEGEAPRWSAEIEERVAVLHDERRVYQDLSVDGPRSSTVISQGGIVYDAPIDRYLYTSWTEFTWELYESSAPWGPWELFARRDFGPYPWYGAENPAGWVNGGYAVTTPSKFISADGLHLWAQANWFVGAAGPGELTTYHYALRPIALTLRDPEAAPFEPEPGTDLTDPATGSGAVVVDTHARYGNIGALTDDNPTTAVSSWNGTSKLRDQWGIELPHPVVIDEVVMVPGPTPDDGGWFEGVPAVEVRIDGVWSALGGVTVSPAYPGDASAADEAEYRFTFEPVAVDGVRIAGTPGGSGCYTTIAELEVLSAG